jgi:hypothetical protein
MAAIPVRDFSADEEAICRLWRYLSFEKFVSLLELSAMWFSRLGALQDKFEGTLPKRAHGRMLERDRKLKTLIPDPRISAALDTMTDRNIENGRAMMAVNCWFLDDVDSLPMWDEYDPRRTGVALCSSVRRLSLSFDVSGDYRTLTWIGRVHYVDFDEYEIDAQRANDAAHRAFLKHKKYDFEKEVRIVTLNSMHLGCLNPDGKPVTDFQLTGPGLFDPDGKGFYLRCSLPSLVQSIVLNPRSPLHMHNLIARLLSRYQVHVPLLRSSIMIQTCAAATWSGNK